MSLLQDSLKARHSYYGGSEACRDTFHQESSWKSDVNVTMSSNKNQNVSGTRSDAKSQLFKNDDSGEYYKRYEHDEVPVKDESHSNKAIELETKNSEKGSLTNSDLEKLENKIYKNISQELQTDDSSVSSLESNIKFFKTSVQEIFDNFFSSMKDFEESKKRFRDILAKNQELTIADCKKIMIQHLLSSDSCLSRESRNWAENTDLEVQDEGALSNATALSDKQTDKLLESLHSVVEAYKNENYLTDSTLDDKPSKHKNSSKKEEILNIYLLSEMPYVQIKMNDRNLLSEINIKDQGRCKTEHHVASADNLSKLAAKRQELERYVKQQEETLIGAPDREIPVKISFAKKNIYLNEDFAHDCDKGECKSLMSKICNYICKKFRKNSF